MSYEKKRIYFLVNDLLIVGGVSSFVMALASELKFRLGCLVSLIGYRQVAEDFILPLEPFLGIFEFIVSYENNPDEVINLLSDSEATIVSLQFDVHFALQKFIKSKSVLLMFHGDAKELNYKGFYRKEFVLLNYFFLRKYQYLILLSESSKTELSKNVNYFIRQKIKVIPNGIFSEDDKNLFSLSGRYVYIGRLSEEKNVQEIIELFSDASVRAAYKIDIYGDGPLTEKLQWMIEERGLQDIVFLKGHCNDKEEMFGDKQGLLLTSLTEGLPMVILEANKYGIPVFCYNTFSAAADLVDGEIGCLISPGDRDEFAAKITSGFVPDQIKIRQKISNYSFEVITPLWVKLLMSDSSSIDIRTAMQRGVSLAFSGFSFFFVYVRVIYFLKKIKRTILSVLYEK